MAQIDLAALLGLERDEVKIGDKVWAVLHPGELSFEKRAEAIRLLQQFEQQQQALGIGDPSGETAAGHDDDAASALRTEASGIATRLSGLILEGPENPPFVVQEAAIRLFFDRLTAQSKTLAKLDESPSASGDSSAESPPQSAATPSSG